VARVARDSRLLVDVVQPFVPGYSILVDRFRLRHLVHQARDLANPPERLTVSILVRDDVPDLVKGDGPKLLRALAHLIGVAAQHVDGDALFVTVSGRPIQDDVLLQLEVRGDGHINPQRALDSLGLRAASAMARGLGGRLEVVVSAEEGVCYTIHSTVAMHFDEDVGVHREWDAVEAEVEAWSLSQTQAIPRDLSRDESLEDAPTSEWQPVREAISSELELPFARAVDHSVTRSVSRPIDDEAAMPATTISDDSSESPGEGLGVAEASRQFGEELERRKMVDLRPEWRLGDAASAGSDSQVTALTDTDIDCIEPDAFYGTPRLFEPEPMRPVRRTSGSTPVVEPTEGAGRLVAEPSGAATGTDPLTIERRVLVVDDDAMARWSMTGQLSVYGYMVDAVANGRMALQALDRRAYAAVIIATNMPGMTGFETAIRIRSAERDGPYVPLIAVSEEGSSDEHARCLAAGINELVHKPVDGEALATMVDRLAVPTNAGAVPATRSATKAPTKSNVRSTTSGIDMDVIERLERIQRVSDQSDLLDRMVDTFAGEAIAAFDALELGLDESDRTLIRITSDRLRRSCATLGIVDMERLCNLLADETRATGLERAREHIDGLDAEYRRVIPLLRLRASTRRPARI
jgi:CheY-like chemotaxis protein/HPt (histidine-containing phosphotransfer) domain-containing protein